MDLRPTWCTASCQSVTGPVRYEGKLVDADLNTVWRCRHTDHATRDSALECAREEHRWRQQRAEAV